MSFYSGLDLTANRVERIPSKDDFVEMCKDIGLLRANAESDFCNLAEDVMALFDDTEARAANNRFFSPDSISFNTSIQILSNEGQYEGDGYYISIHGNGYFFPWTQADLQRRVLSHPKLISLRDAVQSTWGGHFKFPLRGRKFLRSRMAGDGSGWVWFMSESM
jgi:hypothetical protein